MNAAPSDGIREDAAQPVTRTPQDGSAPAALWDGVAAASPPGLGRDADGRKAPDVRPRRGRSLVWRLTVAGTAVLTFAAAVVAVLGATTTAEFLTARYREHLRVLAEYAAMHTELGILLQDPEMVRKAVEALPERADLVGLTVQDAQGRALVVHMRRPEGAVDTPLWVEAPVWTREIREAAPGVETGTAARLIGTVRLGYSLNVLQDLLWKLSARFALFTMAVILLSVVIYGWIARSLTRPLRRLEATAHDVAHGLLDVRAPEGGLRETDQVARMFNAMLDALAQREKDLEQLNARLARREALAEVGRFSSMVAHEIKNPLTIIRGSLQALRRPDPTGQAHATVLRFLEEETLRIDRLVGDFLLFAKPVVPHKRPGDWNRWLHTAVEKMRLMADGAERVILDRTPEEPCPARFDPALMETALGHLVRNALEAAPGRAVHLEAWVDDDGNGGPAPARDDPAGGRPNPPRWCLAVTDEGPGVPEEHREKIFEPFFTTKAKGSGLGLAMVRRVVESHGGTVFWEPRPDGPGSRFVLCVPLAEDAP